MSTASETTRFFVALLPPAPIQDYANQVIQELGDRYRTRTAKAPPHVTLQPPFLWDRGAIAALEDSLHQFAQTQVAVPVVLSGFGAFSPRVLYINVLKTPELLTLQAQLLNHLEVALGIVDAKAKQRGFSPHLTVASLNLTRETFRQAWSELWQQSVEFSFVGDRLTLLIYNGQNWDIRAEFSLISSQSATSSEL